MRCTLYLIKETNNSFHKAHDDVKIIATGIIIQDDCIEWFIVFMMHQH